MQTIGERVDIVIRQSGLNKTRFAERLHLSQQFISSICSGVKQPSDRTITDICREFGVSETWLRTGEGTMFVPQTPDAQIAAYVASTLKGSNEFKKAVLSLLLSRSDEELAVIERAYRDLGVMLAQRERQRSDPDAL